MKIFLNFEINHILVLMLRMVFLPNNVKQIHCPFSLLEPRPDFRQAMGPIAKLHRAVNPAVYTSTV